MNTFELSSYQQDIIRAFKETKNNIFIDALAGCGKTSILVEISKYINTYSLFIAFNKSIQEELKQRITNPKFKVYTFNGLGFSIMNNNWSKMEDNRIFDNIGGNQKRPLTLNPYKTKEMVYNVSQKYKDKIMSIIDYENDYFDEEEGGIDTFYESVEHLFDLCRQKVLNINSKEDIMETVVFYDLFAGISVPDFIYDMLNDLMILDMRLFKEQGIIDFIDQIFLTYVLVRNGEWELEYFHKFDNILVDEIQDTNILQQLFIGLLRRSKDSRYVLVGDKNQAIYSFSGADCHAVDKVQKLYKTDIYSLPINYRCPIIHLKYVNNNFDIPIIARDNAPKGKIYEIEYEDILKHIKPGDCILSRVNSSLCEIALELLNNGFSIYIRDEKLVNKLIAQIQKAKKEIKNLEDLPIYIDDLKDNFHNALIERHQKLNKDGVIDNTQVEQLSFTDTNIDLLDCITVIFKNYTSLYEDNPRKLNNWADFIDYINSMLKTKNTKDSIQCTSIHQAKGKEYDRVFILNKARPFTEMARNADQWQQEKNLSYIAMTRSKSEIYLVESVSDEVEFIDEY